MWCSVIGEGSHTFITYENEAIYVNFKFLLFCVLMISCCCCCVCSITHGQQQQAEQQQQQKD